MEARRGHAARSAYSSVLLFPPFTGAARCSPFLSALCPFLSLHPSFVPAVIVYPPEHLHHLSSVSLSLSRSLSPAALCLPPLLLSIPDGLSEPSVVKLTLRWARLWHFAHAGWYCAKKSSEGYVLICLLPRHSTPRFMLWSLKTITSIEDLTHISISIWSKSR